MLSRPTACLLAASALVLSACAGLSGQPGKLDGAIELEPTQSAHQSAEINWDAERNRIVAAFADPDEIDALPQPDDSLLLRLPAANGFAKGSAEPAAPLKAMLDRVTVALEDPPVTELSIIGHTDSIGSETTNLQLSIRRAEAVMEYLRQRGIALTRMSADGHGEAEPIADNNQESGRSLNRRVEIHVRPLK